MSELTPHQVPNKPGPPISDWDSLGVSSNHSLKPPFASIGNSSTFGRSETYPEWYSNTISDLVVSRARWPLAVLDFIIVYVTFVAFTSLSPTDPSFSMNEKVLLPGAIFSTVFIILSTGFGLFDRDQRFYYLSTLKILLMTWFMNSFMTLAITYMMLYHERVGRVGYIFGCLGSLLAIAVVHGLFSLVVKKYFRNFVVLGKNPKNRTESDLRQVSKESSSGYYRYCTPFERWMDQADIDLTPELILKKMSEFKISDVVVSSDALENSVLVDAAILALKEGFHVTDENSYYTEVFERYPENLLVKKTVFLSLLGIRRPLAEEIKRTVDLIVSLSALFILSPVLLLISIVIKISDRGPILFVQERTGRFGKPFRILKFRTMSVCSKTEHNPDGSNHYSTFVSDTRITPVGRFLRKWHLDELPQIWNILRGQMSFVGPRPEVTSFTNEIVKLLPAYEFRYLVRPGLTGVAQLKQGYTFHQFNELDDVYSKLSYDLYYVRSHNVILDVVLILQTAFHLAKGSR